MSLCVIWQSARLFKNDQRPPPHHEIVYSFTSPAPELFSIASPPAKINRNQHRRSFVVVALLGPAGVGKSAFSRHMAKDLKLKVISLGEQLRLEVARGSELGAMVNSTINRGVSAVYVYM